MMYPRFQSENSRNIFLASLVGLLFLLVGYGWDVAFADQPQFFFVDDVIICAAAGALVYTSRRHHAERVQEQRKGIIHQVDLYVRNELRTTTLGCRLPQEQERCLNCIERLDYVLGEMMPDYPKPPVTTAAPANSGPNEIAELRGRRILKAELYRDLGDGDRISLRLDLDDSHVWMLEIPQPAAVAVASRFDMRPKDGWDLVDSRALVLAPSMGRQQFREEVSSRQMWEEKEYN